MKFKNILGHDHGFVVFKLERERPAMTLHQNTLFYVKEKAIRVYDFTTGNDVPILVIKRGFPGQSPPPRILSYNPAEHALLLTSGTEEGNYQIYTLPKEFNGIAADGSYDSKSGRGEAAMYVARNKFAVFEKSTQVLYFLQF